MEKKIDRQVQFWAVLGPFILTVTLLVSFMAPSLFQKWLAAAGAGGIPLCWRFKLRGLAGAAGALLLLYSYFAFEMPLEQLIWNGGLALSTLLAFAVTALSLEEVEGLIGNLELQSKSRLDQLWRLDEKLKELQEEVGGEREELAGKLRKTEEEAGAYKERLEAAEKLVQTVREELLLSHEKEQQLFQQLQEARAEEKGAAVDEEMVARLQEEIAALKKKKAPKGKSPELRALQTKVKQQQKLLDEKEENLSEARAALFRMQEKLFEERRQRS